MEYPACIAIAVLCLAASAAHAEPCDPMTGICRTVRQRRS